MNPKCSIHNFVKYWPIFKILSLLQYLENLQCSSRSGWSSGLPDTSFTVGTERGSTADLSYEIRGPHHRRSCLSLLAARPGADRLQGRCAGV